MYIKIVNNEYVFGVAISSEGTEISEEEYNQLTEIIHNMPVKPGYVYKLKTNLTWEEHKHEPEPQDEISDTEAIGIILGGES